MHVPSKENRFDHEQTERKQVLFTYFQPSNVLQHSQWISATSCRPVSSTRSSAALVFTLTLK